MLMVKAWSAWTLLGLGLVFDLVSLLALISTVCGKFSSGFPLVGAVFYLLFAAGSAIGVCHINSIEHPVLLALILVMVHISIQYSHYRVSRRLFPLSSAKPSATDTPDPPA
jgi:hypothetical protein